MNNFSSGVYVEIKSFQNCLPEQIKHDDRSTMKLLNITSMSTSATNSLELVLQR